MHRTKAYRIKKHLAKVKRAEKMILNEWGDYFFKNHTREEIRLWAAHYADTMKRCSCSMCCNQRRSSWNDNLTKLTLQERKDKDRVKEELSDLNNNEDGE
jgi:hypothetical protein